MHYIIGFSYLQAFALEMQKKVCYIKKKMERNNNYGKI